MAQLDKTIVPGYPTKWGNKNVVSFDWQGPTLYTVGGETITASELGLGGIEGGFGGVSQSGTYSVQVCVSGYGAQSTCKLLIFLTADGAEAGAIDLDAEIFKLTLVGV